MSSLTCKLSRDIGLISLVRTTGDGVFTMEMTHRDVEKAMPNAKLKYQNTIANSRPRDLKTHGSQHAGVNTLCKAKSPTIKGLQNIPLTKVINCSALSTRITKSSVVGLFYNLGLRVGKALTNRLMDITGGGGGGDWI